jgi:hypothetical protein
MGAAAGGGRGKMKILPEQRPDALKLKEELQAKLNEKLKGLSPEEEIRKIRELVEKGPFGDLWKRLHDAKVPSSAGG